MELTRVYDTAQVDAYVAHLHAQIGALKDQIAALEDRLALPTAADDTEAAERILGRVLLRAQQVADEAAADGRRERDEMVADAHRERNEILARAEHQRKELLEVAERDAAAVIADARRERDAILSGARTEAAGLMAEADEEARAIVARAEEAREMQALLEEVRRSDAVALAAPSSPIDPSFPHQIVAFPWATRRESADAPPAQPEPPATPAWVAAAPPTGAPVIPLVGAGEPAAPLPAADTSPGDRADARRVFPFRR
jgi:cell division septum initiation protein DivIVA